MTISFTVPSPSDIKEAVEATQGSPITRTKLRLVYAAARVMFELDPIDVGAPPIQSQPPESKAARASRSDGGLSGRLLLGPNATLANPCCHLGQFDT